MNSQSLARGLAFFSVGLGLTELLAPRPLARAIGVDEDNDTLLRLLGLRELGAGMGMMQGNPGLFAWSRVAGDAMDLGLLGAALRKAGRRERPRVITALAAVAGVTALDVLAGVLLSRNPAEPEWKIERDDRGGYERGDPVDMRRRADETMAGHQSGHFRGPAEFAGQRPRHELAREDEAVQQFEPGD